MPDDEVIFRIGQSSEIIEIATTPARAFILLAQLQLALRHPHNTGPSADIAREMANNLARLIIAKFPESQEMIQQGFNPAFDLTREYWEQEFCSEL